MVKRLEKFHSDDDGTIAIESLIWFPVYVIIASLIVDTTSMVMTQTRMHSAASDAARLVAIGRLSESEAEDLVEGRAAGTEEYNVDVNIEDYIVTASVSMDFSNLIGLGFLSKYDGTLESLAYFRIEPSFEIEGDDEDDDDDADDADEDDDSDADDDDDD